MARDNVSIPVERATSGTDFEDTLSHAERLLAELDRGRARVLGVWAVVGSVDAVLGAAVALGALFGRGGQAAAVLAVGALAMIVVVAGARGLVVPARRRLRRDELIMVDLVDMLRELLPMVASEEQWSHTRSRLARARLARFPVGARPGGSGLRALNPWRRAGVRGRWPS